MAAMGLELGPFKKYVTPGGEGCGIWDVTKCGRGGEFCNM